MSSYPNPTPGGSVRTVARFWNVLDGAQWSAWPWVPGAMTASGRDPGPLQGARGCR